MVTNISHLVFSVRTGNLAFYKDLMAFLGWKTIYADENMLGVNSTESASLWFAPQIKEVSNDYDGPGLNHIGIGVPSVADVDAVCAWLKERSIAALFETPRHRPDFSRDEQHTYYQVMFESPDRILWEVVYTGLK